MGMRTSVGWRRTNEAVNLLLEFRKDQLERMRSDELLAELKAAAESSALSTSKRLVEAVALDLAKDWTLEDAANG